MQCPTCYNDTLSPSEEGKLVCDECGEEFAGYREEEMDAFLAGTAVSNRESQSSQARNLRARIVAKRTSSAHAAVAPQPSVNDELLLCEGVFLLAKAIVKRLIALEHVHESARSALFEILTCWVRRREAGHKGLVGTSVLFRPSHVLAMVCLAALYVRSPMLPRDLCRLVVVGEVPYFDAFEAVFPERVQRSNAVRELFSPVSLPTAAQITYAGNVFANDVYTWPPLREMLITNVPGRLFGKESTTIPDPFPLGHLHITLLRMTRLLGLPDEFGARVLRFIELRQIAVKMARVVNGEIGGPFDASMVDACEAGDIPNFIEPQQTFSKSVNPRLDLYGFPTDLSIQIDVINTMRICYGRFPRARGTDSSSTFETSTAARERVEYRKEKAKLRKEWDSCKKAMDDWLSLGSAEDRDSVLWASLPPNILSSLHGEKLMKYRDLVENVLAGRGERVPDLWGRFMKAFEEIGAISENEVDSDEDSDRDSRDAVGTCWHDSRCHDFEEISGKESVYHMDEDCGLNREDSTIVNRQPLRKLPGVAWRKSKQKWKRRLQRAIRHRLLQRVKEGKSLLTPKSANVFASGAATHSDGTSVAQYSPADRVFTASEVARGIIHTQLNKEETSNDSSVAKGEKKGLQQLERSSPLPELRRNLFGEEFDDQNNSQAPVPVTPSIPSLLVGAKQGDTEAPATPAHHFARNEDLDDSLEDNIRMHPLSQENMMIGREPSPSVEEPLLAEGYLHKEDSLSHAKPEIQRDSERGDASPGNHRLPKQVKKPPLQPRGAFGKESDSIYQRMQLRDSDFLWEPAGIGLAWSILRRFFSGSNIAVIGSDCADWNPMHIEHVANSCNQTLRIVIEYLLGMQNISLRKDLRWRALSQTFEDLIAGYQQSGSSEEEADNGTA